MHQNGVGNGAVSVSGGIWLRIGHLVPEGVERSLTQKSWRPGNAFTRNSSAPAKICADAFCR